MKVLVAGLMVFAVSGCGGFVERAEEAEREAAQAELKTNAVVGEAEAAVGLAEDAITEVQACNDTLGEAVEVVEKWKRNARGWERRYRALARAEKRKDRRERRSFGSSFASR